MRLKNSFAYLLLALSLAISASCSQQVIYPLHPLDWRFQYRTSEGLPPELELGVLRLAVDLSGFAYYPARWPDSMRLVIRPHLPLPNDGSTSLDSLGYVLIDSVCLSSPRAGLDTCLISIDQRISGANPGVTGGSVRYVSFTYSVLPFDSTAATIQVSFAAKYVREIGGVILTQQSYTVPLTVFREQMKYE